MSLVENRRARRWRDVLLAQYRDELVDLIRRQGKELEELVERESDRVITEILGVEARDRGHLYAAGQRDAVRSSAAFALAHMPTVPVFRTPIETLAHGLALAPSEGMALEFGVYTGRSLRRIAETRGGREVYGFDSFEGLPEDWRSTVREGTFRLDAPPRVDGANLVIGLFANTLPTFLTVHLGPVAFLHLDADLYSSTKTVLDHVGPRLRLGSVIVFDEYFNYPGWEQHEHRAWREFVERTGTGFSYEGYTVDHQQVVVRITEVPAAM
jgi:hypothetical protein